jgi:hypothetical protein
MAMVSSFGQNDESVRFQSLRKKAGSAFPLPLAMPGMARPMNYRETAVPVAQ